MTAAPDEEVMKKLIAVDGVVFNSGLRAPASLPTWLGDYQSAVAESTKATLTSHAVAELKNRPDAVFHNDYTQPGLLPRAEKLSMKTTKAVCSVTYCMSHDYRAPNNGCLYSSTTGYVYINWLLLIRMTGL